MVLVQVQSLVETRPKVEIEALAAVLSQSVD
jgi:hypothetical protein